MPIVLLAITSISTSHLTLECEILVKALYYLKKKAYHYKQRFLKGCLT